MRTILKQPTGEPEFCQCPKYPGKVFYGSYFVCPICNKQAKIELKQPEPEKALYIQKAQCPICSKIIERDEITFNWFPGGSFPAVCATCNQNYNGKESGK